jgi:hypothetical protein
MPSIAYPLVWAACLFGHSPADEGLGTFLYQPAYAIDDVLREPAEPYVPQEGDIVFFTESSLRWGIPFTLACSGHPYHSGIILRRPDGRIAILEAGPYDTIHCEVLELLPRLFGHRGTVWVRRRRVPLTPEQSARLTAFGMAQDSKPFAVVRIAGQLTPLRSRGPLRTWFMGGPHGNRRSYFCSELVLECCVAAGLLDPATTRPCATYPRDMFFDRSLNLFLNKHFKLSPGWYPPQRWTGCP